MIKGLTDRELEQASGGNRRSNARDLSDEQSLSSIPYSDNLLRAEILPIGSHLLSETEERFFPIDSHERRQHTICLGDGMHARWERYRPQQPSFRSRFINRCR